jgi:hypothetical protein
MTMQFFHAGDNIIVGSKDGKLCWFDTDLSTKPYKMLKYDFSYLVLSLVLYFFFVHSC